MKYILAFLITLFIAFNANAKPDFNLFSTEKPKPKVVFDLFSVEKPEKIITQEEPNIQKPDGEGWLWNNKDRIWWRILPKLEMPHKIFPKMTGTPIVTEVSESDWQKEVVESKIPVLVDFYADWCVPCRQLQPTIDKLAQEYSGKIKVVRLNTDNNPNLTNKYHVTSIPRVLFFKQAEEPSITIIGLVAEQEIVNGIKRILNE